MPRVRLLRKAGAEHAKVLMVAVDTPQQSLKIVQVARKHFPKLRIVARARDVSHWHALRDLGVTLVERELFESSLQSARTVLECMGMGMIETRTVIERFRAHNLELAERLYPHHKDRERFIAAAKQGREQLVEQMAREREERANASLQGNTPPAASNDARAA